MRLIVALALTTMVIGCGSHPLNGNGGGDGGNGTGTGGNGSSTDMQAGGGGGGNGKDMSAIPTCDVGKQTGCPMGDKCVPQFGGGGGGGLTGTCVAGGTAAEGQPCTPGDPNSNTVNDNCVGGTMCDNSGPNSTYVCHKICTADAGCTTGSRCGAIFNNANYGLCYPTCALYGTGCPAGNDCSVPFDDISATNSSEVGFFVCKKTGTTPMFAQCQQDSDCAAGLACDGQIGCYPMCDASHVCPHLPVDGGTFSCNPLVSQPNGAGYCG